MIAGTAFLNIHNVNMISIFCITLHSLFIFTFLCTRYALE